MLCLVKILVGDLKQSYIWNFVAVLKLKKKIYTILTIEMLKLILLSAMGIE